jgi:transposase
MEATTMDLLEANSKDVSISATETTGKAISTQVKPRPSRRRFTQEYKIDMLAKLDACEPAQRGILLRQEGLYASVVCTWKKQRQCGTLLTPGSTKRGRKVSDGLLSAQLLEESEKRIILLSEKLRRAELIIEVQKKVATMFDLMQLGAQS